MNILTFFLFIFVLNENLRASDLGYKYRHSEELTDKQFKIDFRKASLDKEPSAAHRLARHYWAQDKFKEALSWMRIAAVMGYAQSQHEFYVLVKAQFINDMELGLESVLWLEAACRSKYEPALFQQKAIAEANEGRDARANFYHIFKVK